MKTIGGLQEVVKTSAFSILRHTPRLRLVIRRLYWGLQKYKYDSLARSCTVVPKKIFFEAYGGRSYSCSPKALYQAMLADDRFSEYEFIWSFKEGAAPVHHNDFIRATIVSRGSKEYFEALATSEVIVMNNRLPEYVYPKNNQRFLQCWHGTPLKRLGYDVEIDMSGALNTALELAQRFSIDAEKWSFLLSPSPYTSEHLADAFGLSREARKSVILELGYPRNDALVQECDDENSYVYHRGLFGVPEGKRAILYAPTWRDDSFESGLGYTFDYLLNFDLMRKYLGNDWVVLFRPHYYIANQFDFSSYNGFVIDVSKVEDINDLYLASDVLLTDYSSVMFDYANLRRPIILFVPDCDRYADAIRGFYFDLSEVPGPLCVTTENVVSAIDGLESYDDLYHIDYQSFVERFCPLDDGSASLRVVRDVFGGD